MKRAQTAGSCRSPVEGRRSNSLRSLRSVSGPRRTPSPTCTAWICIPAASRVNANFQSPRHVATRRADCTHEWPGGTKLEFACDLIQRHGFGAVAAGRHHHAKLARVDQIGASAAQTRGEDSVLRAGRASALHIAEDGHAGLKMGQFLKLRGPDAMCCPDAGLQARRFRAWPPASRSRSWRV